MLEEDDYRLFQLKQRSGHLYLGYCELGKTTIDIFKDGLGVDYPAHKDLDYYSGECQLYLGNDFELGTEFVEWVEANSLSTRKNLGTIELGCLIEDVDEARNILKKHKYLHSIHIEER